MKRSEWMKELERNLAPLSDYERETAMSYYAELYNDKIESGERERDILAGFGDPQYVARAIIADSVNAQNGRAQYAYQSAPQQPRYEEDFFNAPPQPQPAPTEFENYDGNGEQLTKRKRNVFLHVILPILATLVGIYIVFSVCVTIVDVASKENKTYSSDAAFSELVLDISASEVEVRAGDSYSVTYSDSAIRKLEITEEGSQLKLDDKQLIFASWAFNDRKVVVTVPQACEKLDLTISAGEVSVENISGAELTLNMSAGLAEIKNGTFDSATITLSAGEFELENMTIGEINATVSAGNFDFERVSVGTSFKARVSAGSIDGSIVGSESDFSVSTNVSAGSCNLQNIIRESATKHLDFDVSAGEVDISFVS